MIGTGLQIAVALGTTLVGVLTAIVGSNNNNQQNMDAYNMNQYYRPSQYETPIVPQKPAYEPFKYEPITVRRLQAEPIPKYWDIPVSEESKHRWEIGPDDGLSASRRNLIRSRLQRSVAPQQPVQPTIVPLTPPQPVQQTTQYGYGYSEPSIPTPQAVNVQPQAPVQVDSRRFSHTVNPTYTTFEMHNRPFQAPMMQQAIQNPYNLYANPMTNNMTQYQSRRQMFESGNVNGSFQTPNFNNNNIPSPYPYGYGETNNMGYPSQNMNYQQNQMNYKIFNNNADESRLNNWTMMDSGPVGYNAYNSGFPGSSSPPNPNIQMHRFNQPSPQPMYQQQPMPQQSQYGQQLDQPMGDILKWKDLVDSPVSTKFSTSQKPSSTDSMQYQGSWHKPGYVNELGEVPMFVLDDGTPLFSK